MKNLLFLSFILIGVSCTILDNQPITRKIHDDIVLAENEKILNPSQKVTLQGYYADGSSVLFDPTWRVTDDNTVIGPMKIVDNKGRARTEKFSMNEVEIDDIELWRTSRDLKANERAKFGGTFFMIALDLGVGIACLTDPKACFGSCPTFYQGDDDYLFKSDAEGFTNAILPTLEHQDIDALPEVIHPGDEVITMKNEALETHNINTVKLYTVPVISGTDVHHTPDNKFYRVSKGPTYTALHNGLPLQGVDGIDDKEWFTLANERDMASKTTINLTFPSEQGKQYGLKLRFRQSLMSTYLFYGTLENMGSDYGRRMAIMNHSEKQKDWLLEGGIMQFLGGIVVKNSDGALIGSFEETGPIAHNSQMLPLGLSTGELQLELTEGLWRIDHIEIVEIIEEVTPTILLPLRITKNDLEDAQELELLLNEEEHLISLPGEQRKIEFEPVETPSHVFLSSQGFYLEWSRTAWDDPGSPRALRKMLLNPRQYLRDEAAEYKAYESSMEEKFWNARIQSPILTSYEK